MGRITIWNILMLLCSAVTVQILNSVHDEYCEDENVNAKCTDEEVIIIQNATYGRMTIGKCIEDNYKMGCQKNVLKIADRLCSGENTCTFNVFDEFDYLKPCGRGLKSYLDVKFTCVKVDSLSKKACSSEIQHIRDNPIFQLSSDADEANCFSKTPYWHLQGNPGEIIEIKLTDLTQESESPTNCQPLGYIVENVVRSNITICGSTGKRESVIYKSVGHAIDVLLLPKTLRGNSGMFGLQYKAKGCRETYIQPSAYYRRDGDIAEIGCSPGDTRWRLECINREWSGEIGNCTNNGDGGDSTSTFNGFVSIFQDVHESIIIAIVIGIAVLMSIIVLVCGIVYISKHRNHKDAVSETYAHGPRRTEDEFKMYGPQARPDETAKHTPLMYHNTNDRGDMYPTMIDKRDMYPINDNANEVCSCASYSSIPRLDGKGDIKEEQMYLDPTESAANSVNC